MQKLMNKTCLVMCLLSLLSTDFVYGGDEKLEGAKTTPPTRSLRDIVLERYNLLPEGARRQVESCHGTVSRTASILFLTTLNECCQASVEQKVHMALGGLCCILVGGNIIPNFGESVACCLCMTGACAATEKDARHTVSVNFVNWFPSLAEKMGLSTNDKSTDDKKEQ